MNKIFVIDDKPQLLRQFLRGMLYHIARDKSKSVEVCMLVIIPENTSKNKDVDDGIAATEKEVENTCKKIESVKGDIKNRWNFRTNKIEYSQKTLSEAREMVMNEIKKHVLDDGVLQGALMIDLILQLPKDIAALKAGELIFSHEFVKDKMLRDFCRFYTGYGEEGDVKNQWKKNAETKLEQDGYIPSLRIRENFYRERDFAANFMNELYKLAEDAKNRDSEKMGDGIE